MRIYSLAILLITGLIACDKKTTSEDSASEKPAPSEAIAPVDVKTEMAKAVQTTCGNLGMMIVRTRYASRGTSKNVEPVFSKESDAKILDAAGTMLNLAKEAQQRSHKRKAGEYGDFKKRVQESVLAAGKSVKDAAPQFFADCERDLGPGIRECMTELNPEKQRECLGKSKPVMVSLVKKYDKQFKSLEDRAKMAAKKIANEQAEEKKKKK